MDKERDVQRLGTYLTKRWWAVAANAFGAILASRLHKSKALVYTYLGR